MKESKDLSFDVEKYYKNAIFTHDNAIDYALAWVKRYIKDGDKVFEILKQDAAIAQQYEKYQRKVIERGIEEMEADAII